MKYYSDKINLEYLENNEYNVKLLLSHLILLDATFEPALSSTVCLEDYAVKLLKNACVCVATEDDVFLGLFAVYLNNKDTLTAYLSLIAVSEPYKGAGVGCFLLETAIYLSVLSGMNKFKLQVHRDNSKAIALYMKYGIIVTEEPIGNDNSYYMSIR